MFWQQTKKKKKRQVILSALRPLTCNSTRPQHTLQMFADRYGPRQTIPWETINQGLLQPQGELYPIQTILSIAAGISSSSFVRVSTRQLAVTSLSKGISSTLNFHESNSTNGTRTRNLSHPKRAPYRLSLLDKISLLRELFRKCHYQNFKKRLNNQ